MNHPFPESDLARHQKCVFPCEEMPPVLPPKLHKTAELVWVQLSCLVPVHAFALCHRCLASVVRSRFSTSDTSERATCILTPGSCWVAGYWGQCGGVLHGQMCAARSTKWSKI